MAACPSQRAVYVYFRSAHDDAERTRVALDRQRVLIGERLGLQCGVAVRQDQDKPYLTWLEVYEGIAPSALDDALRAIEQTAIDSGLTALALSGRHREVFEPIPTGD